MFFERLTKFLCEYISIPQKYRDENGNVSDENEIKYCIGFLIDNKIFEKEEPKYNTSNDIYINSFKTPLFLHKKNTDKDDKNLEVVLSNLFVFQKYNNGKDDLQERLGNFIQSDSHVLIIEGDAGNGKSSLVGWMNYHYALNDDDSKNMFGDKKLVTIRLRDLNKELIKEKLKRMN